MTTARGTEGYTASGSQPPLAVADEGGGDRHGDGYAARRRLAPPRAGRAGRASSPSATTAPTPGRSGWKRSTRRPVAGGWRPRRWLSDRRSASSSRPTSAARPLRRGAAWRSRAQSADAATPTRWSSPWTARAMAREEMLAGLDPPYALRSRRATPRPRGSLQRGDRRRPRGEVLIVLDDDMRAAPELSSATAPPPGRLAALRARRRAGRAATAPARTRRATSSRKFDAHLARLSDPEHLNLPRSFYTGNASLRAELMREVGGFDESFTVYGNEDVELAAAPARPPGSSSSYDPEALARQEYGKDLRGLARDTLAKGRTTGPARRSHPEVFAELRLAAPRDGSRPWLAAAGACCSRLTRRAGRRRRGLRARPPARAARALAAAALLPGRPRLRLLGRGRRGAARINRRGRAARARRELRRGPIDLLLHR